MTTTEILMLIGIILSLLLLVVVIILLKKKSEEPNENSKVSESFNKSIGEMNAKVDALSFSLKENIELSVQNQMGELLKVQKEQIEADSVKFGGLEKTLQDKIENLNKGQNEQNEREIEKLKEFESNIQKQLNDQFKEISEKVNNGISEGFGKNAETITKVSESLGKLEEAKKNLDALQEQVTSLNGVLSNNKSFGRFGELSLENLLHDVFGDTQGCYDFQYAIKDKNQDINSRPDAVVFMPDPIKTLCIDSKFNFLQYKELFDNENTENEKDAKAAFRDALKGEITKIANDYIIKGKTAEYAILYVPSDGIYSYIQGDDVLYNSVVTYARQKKVVIASPSTLQPILANLNILKFNINTRKNIDKIIHELDMLRKDYSNFTDLWGKFNEEVNRLATKTSQFDSSVNKIGTRLEKINSIAPDTLSDNDDKQEE